MSEKAKLKRCENDLYVAGMGVIIFGAWDVAKVLIEVLLGEDGIPNMVAGEELKVQIMGWILVLGMVTVLSVVAMAVSLYVGLNAQRAARGRAYKKGYFVVAIIMLVLSVLALITYKDTAQHMENIDTTIASLIVDLTGIYVYIMLIRSTIQIRKSTVVNE